MSIGPSTDLRTLAFIVGDALQKDSVTAVLTGGGAATVYAPMAVQSRDLDFVLQFHSVNASDRSLLDLGFVRHVGQFYSHPDCPFTVEFPVGPLAVGGEEILAYDTLIEAGRTLNILSPTDCVRDRLAGFFFFHDFASLEQALAVARRHSVDLSVIEAWSLREKESARYRLFVARLGQD